MMGIGTTVDGGFAEYCVVPQSQAYPIGADTAFEEAAMAEPVACCLHGLDLCQIQPGSHVAVIGGGMIGQIMLQLARLAGASFTALLEPVAEKRARGPGGWGRTSPSTRWEKMRPSAWTGPECAGWTG